MSGFWRKIKRARFSMTFVIFPWWLKPTFTYRNRLSDEAKSMGKTIWYARWLFIEISYSWWV